MDFSVLNENSFWAVPLVVAIVEAFKMSGFNNKFAPIISLIIGVGLSFVINAQITMGEVIVSGIIYGLTASGLYSGVKSTANIRGRVPLRTDKEAVTVETFEVEKPLGETTVQANTKLNVTQDLTQTNSGSSTTDNKPKQEEKPKEDKQPPSQAEKPILEKPVEEVHIESPKEVNIEADINDKPL
jgi:hypothetical protein